MILYTSFTEVIKFWWGQFHIPFWFWQFIVFPILIFWVARSANKLKENYRIKNLAKFIETWIEKSVDTLEKHLLILESFKNELSGIDLGDPKWLKLEIDVDRILNIKEEDLFSVFISKRRGIKEHHRLKFYDLIISLKTSKSTVEDYKVDLKDINVQIIEAIKKMGDCNITIYDCEEALPFKILKMETEFHNEVFSGAMDEGKRNTLYTLGETYNKYTVLEKEWNEEYNKIQGEEGVASAFVYLAKKKSAFFKSSDRNILFYFENIIHACGKLESSVLHLRSKTKTFHDNTITKIEEVKILIKDLTEYNYEFKKLKFKWWIWFQG